MLYTFQYPLSHGGSFCCDKLLFALLMQPNAIPPKGQIGFRLQQLINKLLKMFSVKETVLAGAGRMNTCLNTEGQYISPCRST